MIELGSAGGELRLKPVESALAESRGKVAGTGGAASKLGIPPSTLDSEIKQLRIKKDKFKTVS